MDNILLDKHKEIVKIAGKMHAFMCCCVVVAFILCYVCVFAWWDEICIFDLPRIFRVLPCASAPVFPAHRLWPEQRVYAQLFSEHALRFARVCRPRAVRLQQKVRTGNWHLELVSDYSFLCVFLCVLCFVFSWFAQNIILSVKKIYTRTFRHTSRGVVFYAMIVGKLPFQTPKRANETHDENRNRLVAELKHGLGAKQLNELIKCNNCECIFLLALCGRFCRVEWWVVGRSLVLRAT